MKYRDEIKKVIPGVTDTELNKGKYCPSEINLTDDCVDGYGNCKKCWDKEIEEVNDPVNRPSHYTDGKIEVIDFIEDKKLGFCLGNAIKYIARAGKKDTDKEAQDIKKAIWYLNRYLKELEEASL